MTFRPLEQTYNFALDFSGCRLVVYAKVHTFPIDGDNWYHVLYEYSHSLTPLTRWRRFLCRIGLGPRSNVLDGLVRQWFIDEYSMFSQQAKEHTKL